MPQKSKPEKDLKRRKVAAGVIKGKSTQEIAKDAECSKRHARRLASEPETQFIIREALRPWRVKLATLAGVAIEAIAQALIARKDDKADHTSRLRAIERFQELMEMSQGDIEVEETGPIKLTWDQICSMYEEHRRTNAGAPDAQKAA
jgi:transposase